MLRKDPFITGEYYHVYNRGIDKRTIFKSENDYRRFVLLLYVSNTMQQSIRLDNLINQQHKKYNEILLIDKKDPIVSIGAWCLMPNHFHILIKQESDGGITKFMRKLGVGYSMFFNIKYQRTGALFGGSFKSKLINENDSYLKHLFGYIHLNPLELQFSGWEEQIGKTNVHDWKKFIEEYPYSSYQDYTRINRAEKSIITTDAFPKYFADASEFDAFIDEYLSDIN